MARSSIALRTVIIPAAGKGTRMLPATKVTAKELLPVYDRPVIQFAIDEAVEAGAERIIVVISKAKDAIRHFLGDYAVSSPGGATRITPEIIYVMQDSPKGLGHAVLCCKSKMLPGSFGVILPDDVIMGRGCLSEMAQSHVAGQMIAAMEVAVEDTGSYGIFSFDGNSDDTSVRVTGIVEKPDANAAPSTLAAVGRYILQPLIFDVLRNTPAGAGGEVQLTDAIAVATQVLPLTAFRFSGTRFDCGSHDGLLAASNARQATLKALRAKPSLAVPRAAVRAVFSNPGLEPHRGQPSVVARSAL
ncbi:UTP--glucose-1-phosphate uridylyltransferase [Pseudotabrizicola sediminis]|uniref:UTP--glucose-1-phosphate uridylyltransferase n=1 Tax=Pseudotabrizicola sediminis TaxID=2486418 RepID=A0ABY2KH10_9RHOB|nr:sugar phosphate nucleotidyltransferase [Pseudotabrizicola sediminis]TGD41543.1 UTP--glucose-1-phosphate uridylyltransferase [Pseudotabrizicola sediminis]